MCGSVILCTALAVGAAPVPAPPPPVPANLAPPPRLVRPEVSLIVIECVPGNSDMPSQARLWSLGFRNGKPLPAEQVWEGPDDFFSNPHGWTEIVAGRLLVTDRGGVIDLREKKVLSGEREGHVERYDERTVVYRIQSSRRLEGLFSFDYATGTVTRITNPPIARPWHDKLRSYCRLSPDHKNAICHENNDELILYRKGEKLKSLGKGFTMQVDPQIVLTLPFETRFPIVWLGNDRVLTQRGHGKLVTVDLAGNVTKFATIPDVAKFAFTRFTEDHAGSIYYEISGVYYKIDIVKKAVERSEWRSLGHGFEAPWNAHAKLGYTFRHNGKFIGHYRCLIQGTKMAPGYIALAAEIRDDMRLYGPRTIAVWRRLHEHGQRPSIRG